MVIFAVLSSFCIILVGYALYSQTKSKPLCGKNKTNLAYVVLPLELVANLGEYLQESRQVL